MPLKEQEIAYMVRKSQRDRQQVIEDNMPELKSVDEALKEALKEKEQIEQMFLTGMITEETKVHFNKTLADLLVEVDRLDKRKTELLQLVDLFKNDFKLPDIIGKFSCVICHIW